MQIFQFKIKPENLNYILKHGIVKIDLSKIGDLTSVEDKEIMRQRLQESYGYEGQRLGNILALLYGIRCRMNEGDSIITYNNSMIYLGEIGEYGYNEVDGQYRKVNWLGSFSKVKAPHEIVDYLHNRTTLTRFPDEEKVDYLLTQMKTLIAVKESKQNITEAMVNDALNELTSALYSKYDAVRLQAAIAILQSKGIL